MKKYLKKSIPRFVRKYLHYMLFTLSRSKAYAELDKNTKKIIITLAADYGNIGDIAITYAQEKFLVDNFKDYKIVRLPISRTHRDLKALKKKVSENDIVTIIGGGNMGNLYQAIEDQRQFIIGQFPNNIIISFPQTIHFTRNKSGMKSFEKLESVYRKHRTLLLLAREEKSYKMMKEVRRDVYLTPDIVLYLNEYDNKLATITNKITLCLREDIESSLNESKKRELVSYLEDKGKQIEYRDTHVGDVLLSKEAGESILTEIWHTFSSSELVITDRLHGMIFCAITKTPCIAINNNNGKVADVYERWLKNTNYIAMIDTFNLDLIKEKMDYLNNIPASRMSVPTYTREFKELKSIIMSSSRD